jgi:hypothetical protein
MHSSPWNTGLRSLALGVTLALLSTSAGTTTVTVFGPKTYKRGHGKPVWVTDTFSVADTSLPYTLRLRNGVDGHDKVKNATVKLNGTVVLDDDDFDRCHTVLDKPVVLQSSNQIAVKVEGKPDAAFSLEIFGTSSGDTTPPTISATISPAPNAAHWNNTTVTVTFTCSDAGSGVATCSGPVTVSAEGAGRVVTGTATDNAGNSASTSVTLNIDKTPPGIAAAASPPANVNGWNNTNVAVAFTCSDALSGVASCPAGRTVSAEGADQAVSGQAVDVAGNTATASASLSIDKTPPVVLASAAPAPNAAGWNNTDVAVTFTCSDSLSGVVSCPGSTTVFSEGADQSIPGEAMDRAGNRAGAAATVSIDKTPPAVTAVASPPANANGWNNTDVALTFTCTDPLSGVAACPQATTVSGEGADQAVGLAADRAGNTTRGATVNIDKTPPSVIAAASPPANANGWNNADVFLTYTCADALSGIATCPTPTTVSQEGANQPAPGLAADRAGNLATPAQRLNIDRTAPTVAVSTSPPANAAGWNNTGVAVTFTCGDALSGVASCPAPTNVTREAASQALVGTAVDLAGNTATAGRNVSIDKTPPVMRPLVSPPANANGWNNTDVHVGFACEDALSGVASCPAAAEVTTEGANQTLPGVARDVAGNVASSVVTVNIDKTPPTVLAAASPSANAAGWNNTDVAVSFACSDAVSGVASCPAPTTLTQEGVSPQVGTATDRAGNNATAGLSVSIDKTAPQIRGLLTPPPNAAGWNRSDVRVGFTCDDVLSGVTSCPSPTDVATEGANQPVHGLARDAAGNVATSDVTVSIDKTPPTIAARPAPEPNAAGWNKSDVTVTFEAQDALSGIVSVTAPTTVGSEGSGQAVNGEAVDRAGNTASAGVLLNIDRTAPLVVLTAPAPGTLQRTPRIQVTGTALDTSPLVSITVAGRELGAESPFDTDVELGQEGLQTIEARARDIADNEGVASVTVNRSQPPTVHITSPANLTPFGTTPITMSGTVDDPQASVKVGIEETPAVVSGNTWTAQGVFLREGGNVVTAVATDAQGNSGTDSVTVILDTTAPRVFVDSPADGSTTLEATVTVSGRVNDVVIGTVNSGQATVTVNGHPAVVSNRTFVAENVALSPGLNTITATAVDAVGNSDTRGVVVLREATPGARIGVVSGDRQTAGINDTLPEPLVVAVQDGAGNPLPGKQVIFGVTENNGTVTGSGGAPARTVAVTTAADGTAAVHMTLGSRAGVANNRVEATTPGIAGAAIFFASAASHAAAKINVDSGNGQKGVVGQPLPRPFVAVVTDEGHNRLGGVPVTFRVLDGGGNFAGETEASVLTDPDGRAVAVLTLGSRPGVAGNVVAATIPNVEEPAGFSATAYQPGDPAETAVSGVVLDNSNVPIPGVSLRIRGTTLAVATDEQGQFRIRPVPVGNVHLQVDGSTAQRPGTWPNLEFDLVTVQGVDNTLGMPIFLLPLDTSHSILVDETHGGTLTLPEIPGFSLTVAANSATFPDGTRHGTISVTPVHVDKVPMVPNFGQQPRFIVTIQPPGVKFDPPAAVTHPNVEGLKPGEVVELYSFDHDANSFVATGTATVSEDGTVLRSDPGMGILKGGWHCGGNPNGTGTASDCPVCKKCVPPNCVSDNGQTPPQNAPDDCKQEICLFGGVHSIPANETPAQDSPNDCRTQICLLGSVLSVGNSGETPVQNAPDDCRQEICTPLGFAISVPADEARPQNAPDDCYKEICLLGFPVSVPDLGETPPQNAPDDCKQEICGPFGPMSIPASETPTQSAPDDCFKQVCLLGAIVTLPDTSETPPQNAPDDCRQQICSPLGPITIPADEPQQQVAPDDCKREVCLAGFPTSIPDLSETPPQNAPDDCRQQICGPLGPITIPDNSETPPQDAPNDCRKQICVLGAVLSEADTSETPPQNAPDDCKQQICGPGGFPITIPDNSETPPQAADDDCKKEVCVLGATISIPNDSETLPQVVGNCKKEYCFLGSPTTADDSNDKPMGMECCDGKVFNPVDSCCEATGFFGSREILPKIPVDLTKCVHKVQNPAQLPFAQSTDGCSSPFGDDPAGCGYTRFATANASNPVGCDFHDFCYRSCHPEAGGKAGCDTDLKLRLQNICNTLTPDQFSAPAPGGGTCGERCEFWALKYGQAVSSAGGSAFDNDQKVTCQCCQ